MQGSFGAAAARVYVSNTTLWHEALRRAPDSARAHALLGLERVSAARQGEHVSADVLAAAERSCRHAEQLDPLYELPQLCLGSLAIAREDWVAAYEHHLRAVELGIDRNDRPIAALAQLALDLPSEWFDAHPESLDRRSLAIDWLDRGLRAYPYSPELHAAAARVHHRLGEPERALELYRRARSLRPDRWETVAGGVELALDLGDAAAAHHTWWVDANVLRHADPATRTNLDRRLAAARTQPDFSLLHSLLNPGVFPDEP
jgi:tetratricopeptide (TPR) repeat protein